ncbi:hypothetical protein F4778DRAFT_53201 [Xylariomycetidae sp. FL2044]|nr:hypothetical protein F4778DRAFT_53201 [Xylariomycetidae sp. FL2044]
MKSQDFRRSNGKIPACEPCKKRKVACDHVRPICTRCISRNQQLECVYVGDENPRPNKRRHPADALSPSSSVASGTPAPRVPRSSDTAASPSAGYLGFTSFSAVFEEAGILNGDVAVTSPPTGSHTPCPPPSRSPNPLPYKVRDNGLALLQRIPERARASYLFRKRAGPLEEWIKFVAEHLLGSLYETYGEYLGCSRKLSELEAMAHQLCANTASPFSDDESDTERWMEQFSGQNMRWESIGLLFCFWDEDSSTSKADVDGWVSIDRESVVLCVELCKRYSRGNSLMLYLTYRLMIAESLFSGDASLATWRLHGEAVSLLTFLGIHAETVVEVYTPTVTSEMKRKLCAMVYTFNIICASFTGRPPLISKDSVHTPLPLDLEDRDLALGQVALTEKAARLDHLGWKVEGGLSSTTVIRALTMLAAVREQVLKLAIGKSGVHVPIETLTSLKNTELDIVSHFPQSVHPDLDELADSRHDTIMLYLRLVLRLEHLQNLFFIERLLLRHGQADQGDLLAVSIEMVTYTLYFWTHLDRLLAVRRDCEWLVMSYAAPAGGILCRELLKPRPEILKRSGTTRSKIVQKLSLLVGYLDWIHPSSPNGKLCQTCKGVIEHVLDQAINETEGERENALAEESSLHLDFPPELTFNFDLLDTFDWLRPEFT